MTRVIFIALARIDVTLAEARVLFSGILYFVTLAKQRVYFFQRVYFAVSRMVLAFATRSAEGDCVSFSA